MVGESATRTSPQGGATGPVTAEGGRAGRVLSGLAVALGLVLFLGGFAWGAVVYRPYTVPTGSMTPTIPVGARVLAQRVDGGEIHRGDVVVFDQKSWQSNLPLVKRVVAVGGDTVACCTKGKLTVNGKEIDEPYLEHGQPAEISDFSTVKVPEGRLFMLGDERTGSLDSTAHLTEAASGTVEQKAVRARVEAVVWPMKGMLAQPTGFEELGSLSPQGPFTKLLVAVIAGAVLIFAGASYGSIADRLARRRGATTA